MTATLLTMILTVKLVTL